MMDKLNLIIKSKVSVKIIRITGIENTINCARNLAQQTASNRFREPQLAPCDNPKVVGSNPAPATTRRSLDANRVWTLFF